MATELTPGKLAELRAAIDALQAAHYKMEATCFDSPLSAYIAAADPQTVLGLLDEVERLQARVAELEAVLALIEEGGIKRFKNGMSFRRRCGDCYRAGRDDAKYGKFCHRCGSREELT